MTDKKQDILNISIIGMGALGLLYGEYISNHYPEGSVTFVMDSERYEKYCNAAFLCNGEEKTFHMVPAAQAEEAELVIVAVKFNGLQDALDLIKPCVGKNTIILSVLNGISSEEIIGERYGAEKLIYTVAQGMDAMKFGNTLQYTQLGKLHIGAARASQQENVRRVSQFLDYIKLPYVLESDILYRLWSKFMLNVGVNQTCMVYNTTYSGVLQAGEPNRIMISAMREVVALANAEGIALKEQDINQYIEIIKTLKPEGTPSMGQDRINQKASEVEIFAGTVIKLAQKHHIYVPVNEYLYEKVKEIEDGYVNQSRNVNQNLQEEGLK
jgi:2-dehydropantoate 2-reductase